jgi:hypothetical protein
MRRKGVHGVTNQHVGKIGSPPVDDTLERAMRATEDLAQYAETQQLTEANELLTELLGSIFASRRAPLPDVRTASGNGAEAAVRDALRQGELGSSRRRALPT